MIARILAGLVGVLMGINGLGWLIDPAQAAQGLGMPLLEGVGRSTQVGDFTALFVGTGALCLIGAISRQINWLLSAALLLGLTACFRTLAWMLHGADFATVFVVAEALMTAVLCVSAMMIKRQQTI